MNRTIFAINKNSNIARFVAQANKIKASTNQAKNKQSNNPLIKNGISFNAKNKYGKRKFSTFQNFPNFPFPPEGPDVFFIALALGVSYFIVKKM
jgi:hypothetical protein